MTSPSILNNIENKKLINGNPIYKENTTEKLSEQILPKLNSILTYKRPISKIENLEEFTNGGLIKLAFIGRYNSNIKLLNSFFLNEQNIDKVDLFSHAELHKYKIDSKENIYFHVSDSYPFFANLNSLSFLASYFTMYHKSFSFYKDMEFKTDLFSHQYENCIEMDLEEFNQLMTLLCNNDIVIYTTNKHNENLDREARFFDYIIKRFPIFKYYINQGKFFIAINTHQNDANKFYYENEEANAIFEKLNKMFNYKLIFELDFENSRNEKVIYFYNQFKDKSNLFETNDGTDYVINKHYSGYDRSKDLSILCENYEKILKKKFRLDCSKNFDYSDEYLKTQRYENFTSQFNKDLEGYYSYDLNKIKEFDKVIYESLLRQIDKKLNSTLQEINLIEYPIALSDNGNANAIKQYHEKKGKLEEIINESFNFIQKELSKEVNYFIKKFEIFNEKIENIKQITSEKKSFKGELIYKYKLQFLLEIFDIYGLKHYYTVMSIEAVYIYFHNFKKLFLNFMKLNNNIHLNLEYLNNSVVNFYYDELKKDTDDMLDGFKTDSYLKKKLNNYSFLNLLLFKVFSISSGGMKYKPVFAYYNISNLAGVVVAVVFFIKAFRKYLKFSPNYRKIIRYIVTGILSIGVTYIVSCLLNNYYNIKSQRKFYKLISLIKGNIKQILMQLSIINKQFDEYKKVYTKDALLLLNLHQVKYKNLITNRNNEMISKQIV
jgi:hypothetical protein